MTKALPLHTPPPHRIRTALRMSIMMIGIGCLAVAIMLSRFDRTVSGGADIPLLVGAAGVLLILAAIAGWHWRGAKANGVQMITGVTAILMLASSGPYLGQKALFFAEHQILKSRVIPDPYLDQRLQPGAPFFDSGGYRNNSLPDRIDIVTIGDSQTWGYSTTRQDTWPVQLSGLAGQGVYNLSFPGYGPTQYLVLMDEALVLSPEFIIVGLYTGNDLWGAYNIAYSLDHFSAYRHAASVGSCATSIPEQAAVLTTTRSDTSKQFYYDRYATPIARAIMVMERYFQGDYAWASAHPADSAVYEYEELRTILTPAYRLLALDLNSTCIQEGLRLTVALLQDMAAQAARAEVNFRVLLIPT